MAMTAWAHPGIGIVADSLGNVYYTDLKHVWRNGEIVVRDVHTHELYVDKADVLYGEHLWMEAGEARHRIWRRFPDGRIEDAIATRKGHREDYGDFHFVRDNAGEMYWVDRGGAIRGGRDRTLAVSRRPVGWLAVSGDGASVFYASGGDLYRNAEIVSRGVSENSAVPWHVRAVGWILRVTGAHEGPDHDVGGLWLDGEENVYVAVPGARVVKRISRRGDVAVVQRGRGEWTAVGGATIGGAPWLLENGEGGRGRGG